MPAKKTEGNEASCTGATEMLEETSANVSKEDDMVEIEIFKDTDRYKDDVIVSLNGKVFQIKRGVRVKVPAAVKEILDHSREQDQQTALMTEELENDFQQKAVRVQNAK